MTGPRRDAATRLPTTIACAGCGWVAPAEAPLALACPAARPHDGIDHVVVRTLGPAAGPFPRQGPSDPFVRYRTLFHAYHVARSIGWTDCDYVTLVGQLGAALAAVDGHGFGFTPFTRSAVLSERLGFDAGGGVWVKDETGNVSGSHKARHLFGTLLELEVEAARIACHAPTAPSRERVSPVAAPGGPRPRPALLEPAPLAIASCGNAALAAAVVARAAGRALDVFIPTDAPPAVVDRLRTLGARLTVCARDPAIPGDPTYHALLRALDAGAFPFTCQGNLNGLAIEGGETLGWELASAIGSPGGPGRLDRLIVQVGGGALASSCIVAFEDARRVGLALDLPRFDTVQTRGAHPLERAFGRVRARLEAGESVDQALEYAARHRSAFMWPWEEPPHSVAHGIIDDETYDWLAVVRGMLESGGSPLVVDEATLEEANALGREATGIDVDHTGTSGLAGLIALVRAGQVDPGETVAVLFTGARRSDEAPPVGAH